MTARASLEDTNHAVTKALRSASLLRIPRHPDHRGIILAIVCLGMQRRYAYSEPELNELIQAELARMNATVDHVTCRRYLVDLGFIKRDRAGTRYFLNYPKVEATLSEDAMANAHQLVAQALRMAHKKLSSNRQWSSDGGGS